MQGDHCARLGAAVLRRGAEDLFSPATSPALGLIT
jgi:hypothetical protein